MPNYIQRRFADFKKAWVDLAKLHFPDKDLSSELDTEMLIGEGMSMIGESLSIQADQNYNSLFRKSISRDDERSVYNFASNMSYPVRGPAPALAPIDTWIIVPKDTDCNNTCTYDSRYLITVKPGLKVQKISGTKQTYEVPEEIDFSSKWDSNGNVNRTITPIFSNENSNQVLRYKITKRVIATGGETRVMRFHIETKHAVPNLEILIPDLNIIEVVGVISKDDATDSVLVSDLRSIDWETEDNQWEKMEYLAQDKVWVDMTAGQTAQTKTGYWKQIHRRYVTERNFNNTTSVIFGEGKRDTKDTYGDWLTGSTSLAYTNFLDNKALGEIPEPGTTIFIKYRVGGGKESNCTQNVIKRVVYKEIDDTEAQAAGADQTELTSVVDSFSVNNPMPALGGAPAESLVSIMNNASSWYASQDRCVTDRDYVVRTLSMPNRYGNVFRAAITNDPIKNKHYLYTLTLGDDGKISNSVSDVIKQNLARYLLEYRMDNDIIEIRNGRVINIGIDFTVVVDRGVASKKEVIRRCIMELKDYFDIDDWQMGQPILLDGEKGIRHRLAKVHGVVNIVNVTIKQKAGPDYITNKIYADVGGLASCPYDSCTVTVDDNKETVITPTNNTILCHPHFMFELRHPSKDIVGRAI